MKNISLCLFLCLANLVSGQAYFSKLFETPYPYVGAILGAIETPDSGFILMHTSFDIFQDTNKINIVKIDKAGQIVWQKSYGAEGTAHEQYEIIRTKDSCYVFCGGEQKDLIYSAMLFKINEHGDSIWLETYNAGFYLGFFGKVVETTDGDLIAIGGYDKTPQPPNGFDPWRQIYVVKTDKDGNMLWQKDYGSSDLNDNGRDIVETPDKGFLCSGYIRYPYIAQTSFFVTPIIMKIDSLGNLKWTNAYPNSAYYQGFVELSKTLDGNYLATGAYANNEYVFPDDFRGTGGILLKFDEFGNTIWFKRYGDEIFDAECYDFVELPDSSIVTIGFSHYPDENSSMAKFTSNGELKWVQQYKYNKEWEVSEGLFEIIYTKDHGFFMSGYGTAPELDEPLVIGKGWILKVDSLGCPMPFCVTATEEPPEITPAKGYFDIFPNPTSGEVEVQWTSRDGNGLLEVFNISGIRVLRQDISLQNGAFQLDLYNQPPGVYVVRLRTAAGSLTRKLIIQ